MKISAFVPLKLNSRRLPNKNFLRLGDKPLASHIFETLLNTEDVENVYCYTSQPQVLKLLPNNLKLLMRPKALDEDFVKANELFYHAVKNIDADIIVLCHATGPFISSDSIKKGIDAIKSGAYDCAFSVQEHKTYSWFDDKPLNYSPLEMTQTQGLQPVFTETSGFYIFYKNSYLEKNTRIGSKPFLVPVSFRESVDIDEPKDFALASWLLDFDPLDVNFNNDPFFINLAQEGALHKNIEHVCFDLDGVLIDSLAVMELAWNKACQKFEIEIPFDEYKKGIGMPFYEILRLVGVPGEYFSRFKEVYDFYSEEKIDEVNVYDGVLTQLDRLKREGLKVSLVTSKCKKRTEKILSFYFKDIEFDLIVTPEDVPSGRGKPNPDPLLYTCAVIGVEPFNSIYVGDMKTDKISANKAGFHFIYANWGYGDLEDIKDIWFDKLEDLADYIVL